MTLIENINDIITCLTQAANKIRQLSETTGLICPVDFADRIQSIYDDAIVEVQRID